MYYACPKGKTWSDVQQCLAKHGKPAIVKQAEGAKLVRLDQLENGAWVDGGVYLYAESKAGWQIAGSFFGRGSQYELQTLEPITVGKHAGYRIDLAQASPLHVMLDGVTQQRATRRAYQSLFCSPRGRYCAQALRTCEILVRGGVYWTFRGALKVEGTDVTVTGDRTHAGPFCAQSPRV